MWGVGEPEGSGGVTGIRGAGAGYQSEVAAKKKKAGTPHLPAA